MHGGSFSNIENWKFNTRFPKKGRSEIDTFVRDQEANIKKLHKNSKNRLIEKLKPSAEKRRIQEQQPLPG
jgi:hypothetical protein